MLQDQLGFERVRNATETARLGLDRVRRMLNTRRRLDLTLAEHEAIVAALAARDGEAAAAAMNDHLEAVLAELETFARERPELFADLNTRGGPSDMKKRTFKAPSGETISFTELGFGAAPLGNLYRAVSDKDAQETLDAAWKAGIRYFDTAPLYGLGLSETRLNQFLRGKKRKDYVISTKVGRLLEVCPPAASAPASASSSTRRRARNVSTTATTASCARSNSRWSGSASIRSTWSSPMTSMSSPTSRRPPATRM